MRRRHLLLVGLTLTALAAAGCASHGDAPYSSFSAAVPSPTRPSTLTPTPTPTPTPAHAGAPASAPAPAPPAAASPAVGAPRPTQVLAALRRSGVKLVVEDGWDQQWDLPSRQADWSPVGVMLHHTGGGPGNAPNEQFLLDYESSLPLDRYDGLTGGRRGAALLIGRDGTVYFMRATRGPHAGTGGPMVIGDVTIPADDANGYFYGIEIESAGHSGAVHPNNGDADGFTDEEVSAVAKTAAALLTLLGRGPEYLTDHKAWAAQSQGKPDLVGDSLEMFRATVADEMGR